jgi:hypothetical protein
MSEFNEIEEEEGGVEEEVAKPRKSKYDKKRLPKQIIPITCPDKKNHEKWRKGRDLLDIPAPARICCLAPPNSGKTCFIKNMIIRAKPMYEQIFVVHYDSDGTNEYADVCGEMLSELPDPKGFDPETKKLLILEDLEYSMMNKEDKRKLDRLFGYASTHKFMTVILTAQDSFRVPAICRRCSTVFVLWDSPDKDSVATMARKTGLKSKDLVEIFNKFMTNKHDCLMIDLTHPDYKLRKNGYQIIKHK